MTRESDADTLIRLTVAAIADARDDADVRDALVASGVTSELADRLTVIVPIAFGRSFLERAGASAMPQHYLVRRDGVPDERRALAGDVLFDRALTLARSETFDAYVRCVEWSAEVKVAMKLSAGKPAASRFEGLTFAELVAPEEGDPRPWWRRLAGRPPETPEPELLPDFYRATDLLQRTLVAHGLTVSRRDDELRVEDTVWSAFVFPDQVSPRRANLQLDVRVSSPRLGGRRLVESMGGFAANVRRATDEALHTFLRGSLHPLLHVLHPGSCMHHDDWGIVGTGAHAFRVTMGPALFSGSEQPDLEMGQLIGDLLEALLSTPLTREIHWVRLWALRAPKMTVDEALLDGEPCARIEAMLAGWPLALAADGSTVRLFMVLVPVA